MNAPLSQIAVLLSQWTLLLSLGWGVHVVIRGRDPRWRLILWRSILCLGVALPIVGQLRVPRFAVPVPQRKTELRLAPEPELALAKPVPSVGQAPSGRSDVTGAPPSQSATTVSASRSSAANTSLGAMPLAGEWVSWPRLLVLVWLAGCAWQAIRLGRLQRELRRVVSRAKPAEAAVQSLAWQIQGELKIARPVRVRVSREVASPFLCGAIEPLILLPHWMAEDLAPAELSALLAHELAHVRRHDVAWCVAWQVMRGLGWFHPLAWWIPDAHELACEEEADRVAAQRSYEGNGYAQTLAQLALRVLRLPAPETPLALSATSHLARRLVRLAAGQAARWRTVHSLAGVAMAAALLVLTAGWQFAQGSAAKVAAAPVGTASVLVTVQDENGRPIEGAVITPHGLRAREGRLRSTGYGWVPERHGPIPNVVTDRDGQASVNYPVAIVPAEKIFTGEISFAVNHPDFAPARSADFPVDGTGKPVQLKRGIPLRVAGYSGPGRERVTDIVPQLLGEPVGLRLEDWQREADGSLVWRRMSPGKHYLQLAGRLPSGEIVYSDGVAFFGAQRDSHDLVLELKPGVRIEGRLDARVPRPVRNAWVQLSVHDDEANTQENRQFLPRSFGNTGIWFSYRPVDADGRFVFESVPEGELKVIAYGDGFISANGPAEEQPMPRGAPVAAQPARRATRGVPQGFAAVRPVTTIEVATEPSAALEINVRAAGKPVASAKIYVSPNIIQMPTGSRIFGGPYPSSEAHFRKMPALAELAYSVLTDARGRATLRNIPAFTQHLAVEHAEFEVPLQPNQEFSAPSRYLEMNLSPGKNTPIEIALQPKGREFAGTSR